MRRRLGLVFAIGAAIAAQASPGATAGATVTAWTTYRHDAARSGIDPDSTLPVAPSQTWQTPPLDGDVYGQPLVYGSHVYVATENDTVYELDAGTGAVVWSRHLATPEPASAAPCGDISPSIGITGTPVIDPSTNRLYAVGAVSDSGTIHHELFAVALSSGRPISPFPIVVDPAYPSGGSAVNQLQRPGLALDGGRILIGYGGNAGDCNTYWGWLVSAPASGSGGLDSFQVNAGDHEGAIWGGGNAPLVDAGGKVFVATGNGNGNSTSGPEYGDSVVKLDAAVSPLDWWAPPNWQTLDSTDADLGSSMPTRLPDGYLFQSGKDGNGYLLNSAALGHVSSAAGKVSGFCAGQSLGGSVYDPGNSTLYAACSAGLQALSLGSGSPPSLAPKAGFSAPPDAKGPPMLAGGAVWVTSYSSWTLYRLDPTSGATLNRLSIPEDGSDVNHFASPSAGGGRLFVASSTHVTAFTIAQPPSSSPPSLRAKVSALQVSPHRVSVAGRRVGAHCVRPNRRDRRRRHCSRRGRLRLTYKLNVAATVRLTIRRQVSGRRVNGRCVKPRPSNRRDRRCPRWVAVRGRITRAARAGHNSFIFTGRIGGHRLGPGSYQLILVPFAHGGNGTGQKTTFKFVS